MRKNTQRQRETTLRSRDSEKTQPQEHTTPPTQETPAESETPAETIAVESDPRRAADADTAVLPAVWVYFRRDDEHGYRAVFLFSHREKVSDVRVNYAIPALKDFKNRGYQDMVNEEQKLFAAKELELQLSFLFDGTPHCGSASIKQGNVVSAGAKVSKTDNFKITLESTAC